MAISRLVVHIQIGEISWFVMECDAKCPFCMSRHALSEDPYHGLILNHLGSCDIVYALSGESEVVLSRITEYEAVGYGCTVDMM